MKTEIALTFSRKTLEDIFYEKGDQKLFFGASSKRQSLHLLIGIIAFPFFLQQAIAYESNVLMGIGIVLFGLVCYNFSRVARRIVEWRRSVRIFLDETEKISKHTLIYDNERIQLIQDEEITDIAWPDVKNAVITNRYIRLHAATDMMIPRGAMSDAQFDAFKATVEEKVIQVN
jgi:hypothetical protein